MHKNLKNGIRLFFCLSLLTAFSGYSDTKKDTITYLCDKQNTLAVNDLTLKTHTNSFTTTTKLLQDMNATLHSFDKINSDVINTLDLSMKVLNELAKPFAFYDTNAPFTLIEDFNLSLPAFTITEPLSKDYLLVSSPSRLFPDSDSVKTLFSNAVELTSAWNRAFSSADSSKDLYITILQIEENATLTNLTNGLLIKSSQLN